MPYMHSNMAMTSSTMMASDNTRDLAEMTASALGKSLPEARKHGMHGELAAKVDENGVEYGSSRPPSPPSTGTTTPTLSIAPCPSRLWPFVPPPQYGVVEDATIYRSSYPQDRNMEFIKSLEIKSILTLVETDPTPGYTEWLAEFAIKQGKVTIAPNKEAKEGKAASSTSIDSICEALLFVLDGSNHPLWIHCNQGRHRTGCVVACLRKIQGVPIEEILREYTAYSSPKARPGDIELIKSFDPNAVFTYAKKIGFIGGEEPRFKHSGPDPIRNVQELALSLAHAGRQDSLSPTATNEIENLSSAMSEASVGDPPEQVPAASTMQAASTVVAGRDGEQNAIDPQLLGNRLQQPNVSGEMDVSVVEMDTDEDMDQIETLALHGELDPTLDHETVAAALS